jgi:hypothetical protein
VGVGQERVGRRRIEFPQRVTDPLIAQETQDTALFHASFDDSKQKSIRRFDEVAWQELDSCRSQRVFNGTCMHCQS